VAGSSQRLVSSPETLDEARIGNGCGSKQLNRLAPLDTEVAVRKVERFENLSQTAASETRAKLVTASD
jgi:hypothetical protein